MDAVTPGLVSLGVCAMAKKSRSQPMIELLDRLRAFGNLHVIVFTQDMILNETIEEWPKVHCLIAFHSHGFPLEKACQYAALSPCPYLINDLESQKILLDRRNIYSLLEKSGIPVPKYIILNRDENNETTQKIEEFHDRIVVDGKSLFKPFVEKPVSGDDHNINIYYPDGGGCRRLFRKIKNKSSDLYHENKVRRQGSYVYEKFVPTGRDVKVFAVGSTYAHSESRKSPTVDGIVERNRFGRERRQTERLTDEEKRMAGTVTECFKQTVCGLDLLRDGDKSYIIDVNGWSFVKGNNQYYDRSASIIQRMCLTSPQAQAMRRSHPGYALSSTAIGNPHRTLIGLVAVFRHSDRTPKQKLKFVSDDPEIVALLSSSTKFKGSKQCDTLEAAIHSVQKRLASQSPPTDPKNIKRSEQMENISAVLAAKFSSTKVQLKATAEKGSGGDEQVSALVICKWGGDITEAGIVQANAMGRDFRALLADSLGEDGVDEFIRHAQAFSSQENRVRQSAESFLSTFTLDREELKVTLSDGEAVDALLDHTCGAKDLIEDAKRALREQLLTHHRGISPSLNQGSTTPMSKKRKPIGAYTALKVIDDANERLTALFDCIEKLVAYLDMIDHDPSQAKIPCYHNESWHLVCRRWHKLLKNVLCKTTGAWDVTKIPDIFDSASYDMLHNAPSNPVLAALLNPLLHNARILSDFVVPQEYGVSVKSKIEITRLMVQPLLNSVMENCHAVCSPSPDKPTRCYLYFSNESHMHALRNAILWSGLCDNLTVSDNLELMQLGYCSHAVFRIYRTAMADAPGESIVVNLQFSPGAVEIPEIVRVPHIQAVSVLAPISSSIDLDRVQEALVPPSSQ